MPKSVIERFEERYMADPNSGCWLWTARLSHDGYPMAPRNPQKINYAHRLSYIINVGPIPDGLELDHTCRTRCCVNPRHLEPVTKLVNVRRSNVGKAQRARFHAQTHCKRGHEFTPENTYNGLNEGYKTRVCLTCRRMHDRKRVRA